MKTIENSITLNSVDKIKGLCAPLFSNNVLHFTHDITFTNGQLSELTTEPAVYETWSQKRPSAIFVNESGRILKPGIYLNEVLAEHDLYCKNSLNMFLTIISCNRLISIVEREGDCQHMFNFGIKYDEDDYHQWLLNNMDFFKKFIRYYKKTAKPLIDEVKNTENRMVLPIRPEYNAINASSNLCVDEIDNKCKQEEKPLTLIHCLTLESITFAKQQSHCLSYLLQGKTAKDIAGEMGLSYRTVEHYLETIRKRLGCASNMELIAKYSEQIMLSR